MTQGLQVWNASGELVLDATTRLTQLFGVIEIPSTTLNASGTVSDARLTKGTPFWIVQGNLGVRNGSKNGNGTHNGFWMELAASSYSMNCEARNIICTFSGDTMTWTSTAAAILGAHLTAYDSAFIYYGCF